MMKKDKIVEKWVNLVNGSSLESGKMDMESELLTKFVKDNYGENKYTRLEVKIDINTPFHRHLRGTNGTVESFSKAYGVTVEYFIDCWGRRGGKNIIQSFFKLQEIL